MKLNFRMNFMDSQMLIVSTKNITIVSCCPGWAEKKKTTPWGTLPCLCWNGEEIWTSHAINRFLAREFGLMGKTSVQSGQVDEVGNLI